MMSTAHLENVATVGSGVGSLVRGTSTGGGSPEEVLEHLDSLDVDWWVTDQGDLFIRYWQLGARDFVPVEHLATVRAAQPAPIGADKLEWISNSLRDLEKSYAGQWIAVDDSGVVAAAPELSALLEQVRERGVVAPFVTQIPAEAPAIWTTTYAD
jgi:hypothetical protein